MRVFKLEEGCAVGWSVGDGQSVEERHIGSKDVEECVMECYKLGVSQ